MKVSFGRIALGVLGLGLLGGIISGFLPKPLPVESAKVTRGRLEVTVRDDGRTRIRDRYMVSSPLGGQLQRIEFKSGDLVEAGKTVLATIVPVQPEFYDPRARAMAEARIRMAEAARGQAQALVDRAEANRAYAKSERQRVLGLFESSTATQQEVDRADLQLRTSDEEVNAAQFAVQISRFELEQAQAALLVANSESTPASRFEIQSPITGTVLRVVQESATVIAPGTPVIEVGDPGNMEIEIDVLSADAISMRPGARVILDHWGGSGSLEGRVRRIEPAGFTKISTLGVEEQRVWVVADLVSNRDEWLALGDGYRVEARIIVWESDDVLKVPNGALFRLEDDWAAFVLDNGRGRLRQVKLGQRGENEAEVLDGLSEGDEVIVHPGDRIHDGAAVELR